MNDAAHAATSVPAIDFAVGSILGNALRILRRNFLSFVLLSGIMLLPVPLLRWHMPAEPFVFGSRALTALLTNATGVTLSLFCQGAILHGALQDIRGRPVSAIQSLKKALARAVPLLALSFMIAAATLVGLVLLVVPGLIARTISLASIPACLAEGRGPLESWSRSAALTKGFRWQLFGVTLLLFIISMMVNTILAFGPDSVMIYLVLTHLWAMLFSAYQGAVTAVAYHRLRVLKEGAVTDHVAAVFD